jgi:hypothetical protein
MHPIFQFQYFMVDFCYFINAVCVVTAFFPWLWNGKLLIIAFVMGNGVRTVRGNPWRPSLLFSL